MSPPLPTEEQIDAFVEHVARAHPWHQHIPWQTGAEFVVFLAEDAGAGYDERRPRPRAGWRTTDQYRERFGRLDYQFRVGGHPWARDGRVEPIEPGPAVLRHCRTTLFAWMYSGPEAGGYWGRAAEFDRLHRPEHAAERALLSAWDRAWSAAMKARTAFEPADKEVFYGLSLPVKDPAGLPERVASYLRDKAEAGRLGDELAALERRKLRAVCLRLRMVG